MSNRKNRAINRFEPESDRKVDGKRYKPSRKDRARYSDKQQRREYEAFWDRF